MYFRQKVSGNRSYLQVVEGYRENGRVRQRVTATLGRTEGLLKTGQLDALLASGAKFSQKVSVIGAHKRPSDKPENRQSAYEILGPRARSALYVAV